MQPYGRVWPVRHRRLHSVNHSVESWANVRAVVISAQLGPGGRTQRDNTRIRSVLIAGEGSMADRSGLQLVGYVFCAITVAVMLTAGIVVYGQIGAPSALDEGQSVTAAAAAARVVR